MPWLQTPSNIAPTTLPESAAMLLSRAPQIVAAHVQNFKVHVDAGAEGKKVKDGGSSGGNNNNNGGSDKKVQPEVPATIADTESGRTYSRLRILGKGGFAKCFELRDTSTNVLFAGKVIPKTRVAKPAQREKIDREVALHRTLLHRHVVAFHHSFEDEQNIYIILENCNRKCLANIIRHRKSLTEPEVRYYLRQVAEGVRYLHRLGIVHRDLKLGNFFLTENMDVKIGDFGLATNVEEGVELRRTICGTPNYIAPEVLQKKGHGFAADMWALGCAIYTMLTGKPPFETATLKDTYARILEVQYVMPVRLVTSSKALLRALLCKDPLQRLTLDGVIEHGFLTKEFVPTRLPPTACTVEPRFPTKPVTPKLATLQRCNTLNKKAKTPASNGTKTPNSVAKEKEEPPSVEKKEKDGARLNRVAATFANLAITPSKGKTASTDGPANANEDNTQPHNTDSEERSPLTPGSDAGGSGTPGSDVKRAIQSAVATFACPISPRPPDSSTAVTAGAAVGSRCDRWATRKMLQALATCVDNMPTAENQKPPQWSGPRGKVTWVPKWVDYSNRYGFGYQLSDNSVGLLLNDASLITLCPDKRTMQYYPAQSGGRTAIFTAASAPAHLNNALTLLNYFSRYMEDKLIKGGDMPHSSVVSRDFGVERVPYVNRWFRTDRAIVMILSCNTLQINFDDHVKVILTCSDPEDYVMTYINQQRMSSTYRLVTLAHSGCPAEMMERMTYTRAMLRKVVTMERLL